MFLGFGNREKSIIESRRNSLWQMEESNDSLSLSGLVKVFNFPRLRDTFEINAHLFGVSMILVNKDDTMLFTVGQDNTICMYELTDKDYKAARDRQNLTLMDAKEFIYDEDLLLKVH